MASWPASLPQYVMPAGFVEQAQNGKIRSQPDTGPAKQRRRFTATVRNYNVSIEVDTTQKATLDTFHDDTLKEGVDSFTWVEPISQAAATLRFVSPPRYTPRGPVSFIASFQLEKLP